MINVNPEFWRGRRVLLTGHTGFKGSWLSLWLQSMGAELHGLALDPPTVPALFKEARVAEGMHSIIGDIRYMDVVERAFQSCSPEIVIHMAAQPLVRHSYAAPVETYATNVMGTVHVLDAARRCASVRAIVNVTTDKCYENREWAWGYREDEPIGGHDPYSNSKGCAELVTSAYRRSFLAGQGVAIASARAGNVIGGGDWAADRLLPDVLRAFSQQEPVCIRHPGAIRPWQHVIEPLSGYLVLAERLHEQGEAFAEGWNFGPRDEDARPVSWIVDRVAQLWGPDAQWQQDDGNHPHEAHYLKLDISKVRARIGWEPRWTLGTALELATHWHRAWIDGENMRQLCLTQIASHQAVMSANKDFS